MELRNKYNIRELTKAEVLKQLGKENMVEFVSVVDFHNSNKIFEAALKMTKFNMAWLRNQVSYRMSNIF